MLLKHPVVLFIGFNGTVWNHLGVSALAPPFGRVSADVIEDSSGVREFLAGAKRLGLIVASLSWSNLVRALEALKAFGLTHTT